MQFHSSRDSRRIDGENGAAGDAPRFVLNLAGQLPAGGIDVVAARLARRGDDTALDQEGGEAPDPFLRGNGETLNTETD
jgi:hypothetical protein